MDSSKPIRYGTIWPARHVLSLPLAGLAERVSGVCELQLIRYTDEGRLMADVKAGRVDIASTSEIQSAVPETGLMYLPYLYDGIEHYQRVWTLGANPVAKKIERLIRRKAHLVPLGYSIVGVRDCIFRQGPIARLAEMQGLTFRSDDASISVQMIEAFGAEPKIVNFFRVAAALKDKKVAAAENSLFNIIELRWLSHARFVTCTEHRYLTNFELAAPGFWNAQPSATKGLLRTAFRQYLADFARTSQIARASALALLRQVGGVTVSAPSAAEKARLRRATGPVIASFAATHELENEVDWIRRVG